MSDSIEFGKCDVCAKENNLERTYYEYNDIKCECHSPAHFEVVKHCLTCIPKEPQMTNIQIKTSVLNSLINKRELSDYELDWDCDRSPTGKCSIEYPDNDEPHCTFCGQPEERK